MADKKPSAPKLPALPPAPDPGGSPGKKHGNWPSKGNERFENWTRPDGQLVYVKMPGRMELDGQMVNSPVYEVKKASLLAKGWKRAA